MFKQENQNQNLKKRNLKIPKANKSENSAEYINVFDINATKNEDIPFKRTGTLPIFVKNY